MTPREAFDIIAQHVLARMAENVDDDEWESYPDIGENDWELVVDAAYGLRPQYPSKERYDAAYALLMARAAPSSEAKPS